MRNSHLEQWLSDSLLDFKLSQSEVLELRKLLPELESDEINFVRNRAFQLAREPVHDGGVTAVAALTWLERIVKNLDTYRKSKTPSKSSAHFSPGDECRRKILDLCLNARTTLDISVFTIADNRLADAVIAAHKRSVTVRVITDDQKSEDAGSDIELLQHAGVPVRTDKAAAHMHHKFAIIDGDVLVNGSFNWTRSASDYNQENIMVSNDCRLVAAYLQEFAKLWARFAP